ncbi:MAG: methyltransferase [Desulfobacterales bacterium]|nr:methyltransferase [Desulfobacterales bacterium]
MKEPIHHPGRLLSISGGFWEASALHAAVKLDVFSAIEEGARTAAEAAASIGADPRATGMLLNALTAMELLRKKEGRFVNTEESRRFLVSASPEYVGYIIGHHHHLVAGWNRLDEAVRSGGPVRAGASFEDPEVRHNFLMGMFNLASLLAPQVARRVDLSGRRRLLDLGGGPGTYAIHFCVQNKTLEAVVFDRPETRPIAEGVIARFGLKDRIAFQAGDYLADTLPDGFDVVWVSHILHAESPEFCAELMVKIHAALKPGGIVLVHDFLLAESMDGPLFPALFSLNMLQGTEAGQAYSRGQVESMLEAAGFTDLTVVAIDSPNDSGIVAATK